jgi:NAD(P)-dependent dehydrogenase (short-subunit alcohol dehydrogenase family)
MTERSARDGLRPGDAVVVTGAAQGIGRAVALRLARDGARIVAWDVQAEGGEETARLCRAEGAPDARFDRVDVGDETSVAAAADALAGAWGAPFGLVNNAGIYPRAAVLDTPLELWDRVLRVNLTGQFLCARALGRPMIAAGRGAIVNTASGRALAGAARGAAYTASKGGVLALTRSLALDWARHGIRVNCILPGVIETAMPLGDTTSDELRRRGANYPMGRIGQPDDIAGVVAFLLGADAGYMTGQAVAANGGEIFVP